MNKLLLNIGRISAGLGVAGTVLAASLVTVDGGHRAVVFDRIYGVKQTVLGEGMHFVIPIIQKPIMYEIRTRYSTIQSETGSKDLQTVGVALRILYKPDAKSLPLIHQKLGPDYDDRVLPSLGNEILKAVVAQYDAGELITQREMVSNKIREALTARANDFNICLEDVSIVHVSFSSEFTHAIENKQVAQQEAERSKFVVQKAEQEKKAAVIRASGEAEAARMITEAMTGPGFIELRKIEAAKEIAETLSRSKNITYLPGGNNVLLNLGQQGGIPSNQGSK